MLFESGDTGEHDLRTVRNDFTPGFPLRITDGNGNEPKSAASRIRANKEYFLAGAERRAGVMVSVIFMIVFARRDQLKLTRGIIGSQKADFAGRVAGRSEHQIPAASCAVDFDVKTDRKSTRL